MVFYRNEKGWQWEPVMHISCSYRNIVIYIIIQHMKLISPSFIQPVMLANLATMSVKNTKVALLVSFDVEKLATVNVFSNKS